MEFVYASKTGLTTPFGESFCVRNFLGKLISRFCTAQQQSLSSPRLSTGILLGQLKGTFTELLCTLTLMSFFIGINKFSRSHV